jgi:hypothetical protein
MRNDDVGTPCHDTFERFLDEQLGFTIQMTGCFIQHQDAWIFEDHPRQCHTLLFPSAQAVTALSHDGIVAIWKAGNKFVDIGCLSGCFQLRLGSIQPGIQ